MNTILIQIASYRDDELPKTIASLLERAKYPKRLRFAIVHQYGPETAHILDRYKSDKRFRIVETPWHAARGVGAARRMTDELYEKEDFFLQIDSHMRAEQDWDERLEQEWRRLDDSRAILSSYPPAYQYDGNEKEVFVPSNPNRLVVHDIHEDLTPVFFGKEIPSGVSLRGAFVAGGLQFGSGGVCRHVPYEARICFIGEEVIHSLRLFAAGYAIYSVYDQVLSHLYIRSKHQKNAHHFWNDFQSDAALKKVYADMNHLSRRTVLNYMEGKELVSLDVVRKFENFAGIDMHSGRVHPDTYIVPSLPMAVSDGWRHHAIKPELQT